MSSNIILECSQLDSIDNGDASWTSTFQTPVPLEEGDVVQVKTALINTKSATSSNLVFETDQDLVITVGYYDAIVPHMYKLVAGGADPFVPYLHCYANSAGGQFTKNEAVTGSDVGPTNGIYILENSDNKLFTTDIKFTIPAGSYEPDAIATLLTEGLYNARSTTATGDITSGDADRAGVFISPKQFPGSKVPKARLAVIANYSQGATSDVVQYAASSNPTAKSMVGAAVVEVSFNQGKFEFAQLHSSPKSKSGTGSNITYTKPAVLTITASSGTTSLTATSGVFFTNLQPASFWDALGFSQQTCQDRVYFNYDTFKGLNNLLKKQDYLNIRTTGQLNVFEDLIADTQPSTLKIIDNNALVAHDSSATRKIRGDEYISETNGYYLLEMETNIQTEYFNQVKRLGSTVAVISKQYNSADYITAYGDSAVPYVHIGAPSLLSSINLKIIDPDTKEVAKGLGGRSTVFVEVIKGNTPPPQKSKDAKPQKSTD